MKLNHQRPARGALLNTPARGYDLKLYGLDATEGTVRNTPARGYDLKQKIRSPSLRYASNTPARGYDLKPVAGAGRVPRVVEYPRKGV